MVEFLKSVSWLHVHCEHAKDTARSFHAGEVQLTIIVAPDLAIH